MRHPYIQELRVGIQALNEAASAARAIQADLDRVRSMTKDDRSPVTVADFACQAIVGHRLSEVFPNDRVIAEESADILRDEAHGAVLEEVAAAVSRVQQDTAASQVLDSIEFGRGEGGAARFWTLDPIDGTKGFLRGDQYAVALALVEDGEVRVGLLACPNLPLQGLWPNGQRGALFAAVRGHGAQAGAIGASSLEPLPRVQAVKPSETRVAESVDAGHADFETHRRVSQRLGIVVDPIKVDSQAKYGVIARGDAHIYLRLPAPTSPDYKEKLWDHAAGALLVLEVGGAVTDADGLPLDFMATLPRMSGRGVIATTGGIHQQILEAVRG